MTVDVTTMAFLGPVSAREHYGLRLLLALGKTYSDGSAISLTDVSKTEGISLKYLEQLIVPFRQAGWVTSKRGRSGGYQLRRAPDEITLRDVLWLLNDNEPALVECLKANCSEQCHLAGHCPSQRGWGKVQSAVEASLRDITLAQLLNQ